MSKTILLVGTLDTKGTEYGYAKELIVARGHHALVINAGISGEPSLTPDIHADAVAKAGGGNLAELRNKGDRGTAVDIMAKGATTLITKLYAEGKFDGILALGGSGGTAIATPAMQALPVGVPKVMVSTVASGNVQPYVGIKDVTMMYPVVDIAGINRISRQILSNAVGAICGMVEQPPPPTDDKPLIAATMFGVTTPCVTAVREQLEAAGYEVLVFHATGSGGRAMESLIEAGYITAVADITTTEWCDHLVGGVLSAGPTRLEAAAKAGLPQIVSCGALDMVNFGTFDSVPQQFKKRTFHKHNASVTLMRTTPEECAELGRIIASKLNRATGPTTLFLPLRGVSAIDIEGNPFHNPAANTALFSSLRQNIRPPVEIIELDLHINDPEFAKAMVERLLQMLVEGGMIPSG